jgi:hypothetical protein
VPVEPTHASPPSTGTPTSSRQFWDAAARENAIDVVFSYITLQHIPSQIDQLRYLHESARVLAPGGRPYNADGAVVA